MRDESHVALHEYSGLYVLGALAKEDAAAFEAHVASCDLCAAEVRSLRETAASLPFGVTMVDPPPQLRERVLAVAGQLRAHSSAPFSAASSFETATAHVVPRSARPALWVAWLSAAALALLAVGTGIYARSLRDRLTDVELQLTQANTRLRDSEVQLTRARTDAAGVREHLALLASPDVLDLRLNGLAPAPQARGRALISRTRGLLFAATSLPPLPPARVYQLWFLTAAAPVSAGLVEPDAQGNVTATFDPPTVSEVRGFAVSIEPESGVPLPTGDLYLATK